MSAVLVEGLAIGAEPADHRHVGTVNEPVGAYVFDALLQGDSVSVQGYSKRLPSCMAKSSCRWHCGASKPPEIIRQNDAAVVLDVDSPWKAVCNYHGDIGVSLHPTRQCFLFFDVGLFLSHGMS